MKKIIYIVLTVLLFIPLMVYAEEKQVNMYLFYGEGCPHCKELENFLDEYLEDKDNVKLYSYEVTNNDVNKTHLENIVKILNVQVRGVPYLVIGNTVINGFSKELSPERIISTINYYENIVYKDEVGIYLGVVEDSNNLEESKDNIEVISAPSNIKSIIKNSPIIISTLLIGLVDGFNPCAMWILLFLISMLLGVKNKLKRWTLGIVFILTSGVVYFLFLISAINLVTFLDKISFIRVIISLTAVILGFISVIRFVNSLNSDTGCEVVNSNKRKKIINRIKKIVSEKSFILALLGIVFLAFSVNIIELLCSLGLPVLFTEILSINNISGTMKIVYSIIYIFAFLLDDILVFIISMKTLELKAVSNKFGKYAHLIGGIIMIIIGLLMAYKPQWLMFNF